MCGVFGAYNYPHASEIAYFGLHSFQHRAHEYAGIVSTDGKKLRSHKGEGIVQDVFNQKIINSLTGSISIGQIRYSTITDDPEKDNTQPLLFPADEPLFAIAHNGNLTNADEIRSELSDQYAFETVIDTEVIAAKYFLSHKKNKAERAFEAISGVRGTLALLIIDGEDLIAIRGYWGNRPLSLGRLDNSWFVASETVAFNSLGIEYVRDIEAGEILVINNDGLKSYYFDENNLSDKPIEHQKQLCIFEDLYFSHPDSTVFGLEVVEFRLNAGAALYKYCPAPAKTVMDIPDSSIFHAKGYAEADPEAKHVRILLRSHYIGRTFIEPRQEIRASKVDRKFFPLHALVRKIPRDPKRKVVVVEDSIVRGTTSKKIIRKIRNTGIDEIHERVTTPPIIGSCYFGIDTPTREELMAANHTIEEMRVILGLDSLEFLTVEQLQTLVPNPEDFCYSCMTNKYLIPIN